MSILTGKLSSTLHPLLYIVSVTFDNPQTSADRTQSANMTSINLLTSALSLEDAPVKADAPALPRRKKGFLDLPGGRALPNTSTSIFLLTTRGQNCGTRSMVSLLKPSWPSTLIVAASALISFASTLDQNINHQRTTALLLNVKISDSRKPVN